MRKAVIKLNFFFGDGGASDSAIFHRALGEGEREKKKSFQLFFPRWLMMPLISSRCTVATCQV